MYQAYVTTSNGKTVKVTNKSVVVLMEYIGNCVRFGLYDTPIDVKLSYVKK